MRKLIFSLLVFLSGSAIAQDCPVFKKGKNIPITDRFYYATKAAPIFSEIEPLTQLPQKLRVGDVVGPVLNVRLFQGRFNVNAGLPRGTARISDFGQPLYNNGYLKVTCPRARVTGWVSTKVLIAESLLSDSEVFADSISDKVDELFEHRKNISIVRPFSAEYYDYNMKHHLAHQWTMQSFRVYYRRFGEKKFEELLVSLQGRFDFGGTTDYKDQCPFMYTDPEFLPYEDKPKQKFDFSN
jgi:hypothetical protein